MAYYKLVRKIASFPVFCDFITPAMLNPLPEYLRLACCRFATMGKESLPRLVRVSKAGSDPYKAKLTVYP